MFDPPLEAARFRWIGPPGAHGWPTRNWRFGEIVFHGEKLDCSLPDALAK